MAASCEQQARDLLERMGIENAQSFTAGYLVELANLFNVQSHIEAQYEALRDARIKLNSQQITEVTQTPILKSGAKPVDGLGSNKLGEI